MGKWPDKAGVRRTVTRRAGPIWSNAVALCLDRAVSTAFAKPLGLEPNSLRQNDPS